MSFYEFPHTRTYDSDLGWLIKKIKEHDGRLDILEEWVREYQPQIEDFHNLYDQIMNGDLPQSIQDGIRRWCFEHMIDLVGGMIKHIYFGLTNDGYFCAFIPDNWSDVTFDTIGGDFDDPLWGHLVVMYD